MVRRFLGYGLLVVLAYMGLGCHHHKHFRHKHGCCDAVPETCACASPVTVVPGGVPVMAAPPVINSSDPIPYPRKMPTAEMTSSPTRIIPLR
jgi:hypothetical protein